MARGEFWAGNLNEVPTRTVKHYTWKLCPYSTQYKVKFYDLGFKGNTVNPEITEENFNSVPTADHTTTQGGMNYKNNGGAPGWGCQDDACPFFITNGRRYLEL